MGGLQLKFAGYFHRHWLARRKRQPTLVGGICFGDLGAAARHRYFGNFGGQLQLNNLGFDRTQHALDALG